MDYSYDGTFKSEWQSFLTKKKSSLELESVPIPCEPGEIRKVAVQVIDIFANQTLRILDVHIPSYPGTEGMLIQLRDKRMWTPEDD